MVDNPEENIPHTEVPDTTEAPNTIETPKEVFDAIRCGNRKYTVYGKDDSVHDTDFLVRVMHGFSLAAPGEYMFQGVRIVVEEVESI